MQSAPNIKTLISIAEQAGRLVTEIYNQTFVAVTHKEDKSPLTAADLASHNYICEALNEWYPSIPVLSEESAVQDYAIRKEWRCLFLVDPLDGTKEFLQGNGEFTINIAFIENGVPTAGVIHAPALQLTYYAEKNKGAYKTDPHDTTRLPIVTACEPTHPQSIRIAVSRSHSCEKTKAFIAHLRKSHLDVEEMAAGSALKFGLVAEGVADMYPRFSPTMEWDTAAGQLIVTEAGKMMSEIGSETPLLYNKPCLINPGFLVASDIIRRLI